MHLLLPCVDFLIAKS